MQRSLFPEPDLPRRPPEPKPAKRKKPANPYRRLTEEERARILHKIKLLRIARAHHIADVGSIAGDQLAYPEWIRAIAFLVREHRAILKKDIPLLRRELEQFDIR